ncbi:hypothetical protein GCM10010168_70930 [Actinoplanes ianthinogenes]|uniref:Uncharacterized protein n=1 Tax=Actinoplanes ianthinogenes TaxID=122358 RepID=A0ABM7M6V7_9ACTN|nr:hypothetical protein [Actinoplanes ianthinogenes]BCJ47318.1 hypothetical protein Aiant_79750 [Actinoplanes ianthinogenes]GGR42041.1 hypothetical protein GCM10010168_70930 [Actinoplanes ianthinogenes]
MPLRLARVCTATTVIVLLAGCGPRAAEKPAGPEPSPVLPPAGTVVPSSAPGLLGPDNIGVPE